MKYALSLIILCVLFRLITTEDVFGCMTNEVTYNCNYHGTCNRDTQKCECYSDYYGSLCENNKFTAVGVSIGAVSLGISIYFCCIILASQLCFSILLIMLFVRIRTLNNRLRMGGRDVPLDTIPSTGAPVGGSPSSAFHHSGRLQSYPPSIEQSSQPRRKSRSDRRRRKSRERALSSERGSKGGIIPSSHLQPPSSVPIPVQVMSAMPRSMRHSSSDPNLLRSAPIIVRKGMSIPSGMPSSTQKPPSSQNLSTNPQTFNSTGPNSVITEPHTDVSLASNYLREDVFMGIFNEKEHKIAISKDFIRIGKIRIMFADIESFESVFTTREFKVYRIILGQEGDVLFSITGDGYPLFEELLMKYLGSVVTESESDED